MRNNHKIEGIVECRCPKCDETFNKRILANYVTNQRGDVIDQSIK